MNLLKTSIKPLKTFTKLQPPPLFNQQFLKPNLLVKKPFHFAQSCPILSLTKSLIRHIGTKSLTDYKFTLPYNHADLKLRCTEFDSHGNVKTTAGEFSKAAICNSHSLQPRDLRKIDSGFKNQLPGILVRDEAILVNLLHIKAIIKADMVVLFDSFESVDTLQQSVFIYDLQERLRSNSTLNTQLPLEFRALESMLVSVVNTLQSEMEVITNLVTVLLIHLEDTIDRDSLKKLLTYSKRMTKFEKKVLNLRAAIAEILEQDEDLASMYLTEKKTSSPRSIHQHEEIELLLESYLKQVDEIADVINNLISNVRSTEDIVNIILDSQRNSLLLLELQVTMGTLGLTMGAFIAALFGMNLKNYMEEDPKMFFMVTATATGMAGITTLIFLRRMKLLLRKIR